MTDQTVLTTDETTEDAEYVQAMLDKAASVNPDAEEEEVEEERDESSEEEDEAEVDNEAEEEDTTDANEDEEAEEESSQDESDVISFDDLTSEFVETGTLSDESIQSLEEAGIPREVVEAHLAGLQAQAELTRYKAATAVGGEENLNSLLTWAGDNLNESEIDRINDLVAKGDFDGYLLAMEGVKARYESNYGSINSQSIQGETSATVDIFESQAEMKEAMRDARYQTDEAYRNRVASKLSRTRRSGQRLQ
jgi:hypothetical protein